MFNPVRALAAATLVLLMSASAASAVPIIWTLQNVSFNDGGTASGSFVFDADTTTYSNIMITTTNGSIRPGASYGGPVASGTSNFALVTTPDNSLPDLTGRPMLVLLFTAPLTNAGGLIDIQPDPPITIPSFESICINALCTGGNSLTFRVTIAGGQITSASIPEPTTVALLVTGLLGLALIGRRRRKVV